MGEAQVHGGGETTEVMCIVEVLYITVLPYSIS